VWGLQQLTGAPVSSNSASSFGSSWDAPGSSTSSGSSGSAASVRHPSSPLLARQVQTAAVGAMAFDPVTELVCSGHSDGVVSVWNYGGLSGGGAGSSVGSSGSSA
jgi:hypothetical protein